MSLGEVRWIPIQHADDERGTLTTIEAAVLPFEIKRIFYMHRVPADCERGAHAHRFTHQFAVAVAGRFTMDVSDGGEPQPYVLDDPNRGLYLPPMTWTRLHGFQEATVALVICDRQYNPQHVVRDWGEYGRLLREPSLTR